MSLSKKILLTTAGVIVAMLVASMMVLRSNVHEVLAIQALEYNFKTIAVDKFEHVNIGADWDVRMSQGNRFDVQISSDEKLYNPVIENLKGTLYVSLDSAQELPIGRRPYVKIKVPYIKTIIAGERTRIQLVNYQADSLSVILGDQAEFEGEESTIIQLSFTTLGESKIKMKDDPYQ